MEKSSSATRATGASFTHAFRWEESTGMVDLGSSNVAGRGSFALGVSADGQVAVGYQEQATGFTEGAKWVGTTDRRELPGPDGFVGTANAANIDGSIVVGRICRPTAATSKRSGLSERVGLDARTARSACPRRDCASSPGPLIIVEANATSDDGRVIGGEPGGRRARRIPTPSSGSIATPAYLKDFLQANGVPDAFETWINTGAIRGISPDGRVLVGTGAALGGFRGYIVVLGSNLVMP